MSQNKNVFNYKVGDFEVVMLSENQGSGNGSILVNATDKMKEETMPDGTFPNAVCAFLVKTGSENILIDTGFGRNLFNNLNEAGLAPEDVDVILITHMHGDHTGGLAREGAAAFPEARLYVAKDEYGYWNERGGNALANVNLYKERLFLFDNGTFEEKKYLADGISPVAAYGHTLGHTMFMIESKGERLLIWGDLTHAMAIQMPYPEVAVTYDTDPEQAIQSRKRVLEYVSEEKIPVGGMHIAYPGIGRVERRESGEYLFTEAK